MEEAQSGPGNGSHEVGQRWRGEQQAGALGSLVATSLWLRMLRVLRGRCPVAP